MSEYPYINQPQFAFSIPSLPLSSNHTEQQNSFHDYTHPKTPPIVQTNQNTPNQGQNNTPNTRHNNHYYPHLESIQATIPTPPPRPSPSTSYPPPTSDHIERIEDILDLSGFLLSLQGETTQQNYQRLVYNAQYVTIDDIIPPQQPSCLCYDCIEDCLGGDWPGPGGETDELFPFGKFCTIFEEEPLNVNYPHGNSSHLTYNPLYQPFLLNGDYLLSNEINNDFNYNDYNNSSLCVINSSSTSSIKNINPIAPEIPPQTLFSPLSSPKLSHSFASFSSSSSLSSSSSSSSSSSTIIQAQPPRFTLSTTHRSSSSSRSAHTHHNINNCNNIISNNIINNYPKPIKMRIDFFKLRLKYCNVDCLPYMIDFPFFTQFLKLDGMVQFIHRYGDILGYEKNTNISDYTTAGIIIHGQNGNTTNQNKKNAIKNENFHPKNDKNSSTNIILTSLQYFQEPHPKRIMTASTTRDMNDCYLRLLADKSDYIYQYNPRKSPTNQHNHHNNPRNDHNNTHHNNNRSDHHARNDHHNHHKSNNHTQHTHSNQAKHHSHNNDNNNSNIINVINNNLTNQNKKLTGNSQNSQISQISQLSQNSQNSPRNSINSSSNNTNFSRSSSFSSILSTTTSNSINNNNNNKSEINFAHHVGSSLFNSRNHTPNQSFGKQIDKNDNCSETNTLFQQIIPKKIAKIHKTQKYSLENYYNLLTEQQHSLQLLDTIFHDMLTWVHKYFHGFSHDLRVVYSYNIAYLSLRHSEQRLSYLVDFYQYALTQPLDVIINEDISQLFYNIGIIVNLAAGDGGDGRKKDISPGVLLNLDKVEEQIEQIEQNNNINPPPRQLPNNDSWSLLSDVIMLKNTASHSIGSNLSPHSSTNQESKTFPNLIKKTEKNNLKNNVSNFFDDYFQAPNIPKLKSTSSYLSSKLHYNVNNNICIDNDEDNNDDSNNDRITSNEFFLPEKQPHDGQQQQQQQQQQHPDQLFDEEKCDKRYIKKVNIKITLSQFNSLISKIDDGVVNKRSLLGYVPHYWDVYHDGKAPIIKDTYAQINPPSRPRPRKYRSQLIYDKSQTIPPNSPPFSSMPSHSTVNKTSNQIQHLPQNLPNQPNLPNSSSQQSIATPRPSFTPSTLPFISPDRRLYSHTEFTDTKRRLVSPFAIIISRPPAQTNFEARNHLAQIVISVFPINVFQGKSVDLWFGVLDWIGNFSRSRLVRRTTYPVERSKWDFRGEYCVEIKAKREEEREINQKNINCENNQQNYEETTSPILANVMTKEPIYKLLSVDVDTTTNPSNEVINTLLFPLLSPMQINQEQKGKSENFVSKKISEINDPDLDPISLTPSLSQSPHLDTTILKPFPSNPPHITPNEALQRAIVSSSTWIRNEPISILSTTTLHSSSPSSTSIDIQNSVQIVLESNTSIGNEDEQIGQSSDELLNKNDQQLITRFTPFIIPIFPAIQQSPLTFAHSLSSSSSTKLTPKSSSSSSSSLVPTPKINQNDDLIELIGDDDVIESNLEKNRQNVLRKKQVQIRSNNTNNANNINKPNHSPLLHQQNPSVDQNGAIVSENIPNSPLPNSFGPNGTGNLVNPNNLPPNCHFKDESNNCDFTNDSKITNNNGKNKINRIIPIPKTTTTTHQITNRSNSNSNDNNNNNNNNNTQNEPIIFPNLQNFGQQFSTFTTFSNFPKKLPISVELQPVSYEFESYDSHDDHDDDICGISISGSLSCTEGSTYTGYEQIILPTTNILTHNEQKSQNNATLLPQMVTKIPENNSAFIPAPPTPEIRTLPSPLPEPISFQFKTLPTVLQQGKPPKSPLIHLFSPLPSQSSKSSHNLLITSHTPHQQQQQQQFELNNRHNNLSPRSFHTTAPSPPTIHNNVPSSTTNSPAKPFYAMDDDDPLNNIDVCPVLLVGDALSHSTIFPTTTTTTTAATARSSFNTNITSPTKTHRTVSAITLDSQQGEDLVSSPSSLSATKLSHTTSMYSHQEPIQLEYSIAEHCVVGGGSSDSLLGILKADW